MIFQRVYSWLHRKNVRRILIIAGAAGLMLLLLTFAGATELVGNRLLFYVHIARLYTKDADRQIAMPLKDVSKKEIADIKTSGAITPSEKGA